MDKMNILIDNGVDVESSLNILGDIQTYNDVIMDFVDELREKKIEIEKFIDSMDLYDYSITAHSIKSGAMYLGFEKLADISLKHEIESKDNNEKFIKDEYKNLLTEINAVLEICSSYLSLIKTEPEILSLTDNISNKKVLIVDDSNVIINLIRNNIDSNVDCIGVNNGKSAIDIIEKDYEQISGIFLDLHMPSSNGFLVLDYLKDKKLFDKILVFVETGSNDLFTIEKAYSYPIVDIINKPFTKEQIEKAINQIFKI
ncbi:MAG: response regulator [Bacilli bacterium]